MSAEPHEEFMLVVAWVDNVDIEKRHRLQGRVSVDMAVFPPNPPITDAEMQQVAYAAKMAVWKVLRARAKAEKQAKKR